MSSGIRDFPEGVKRAHSHLQKTPSFQKGEIPVKKLAVLFLAVLLLSTTASAAPVSEAADTDIPSITAERLYGSMYHIHCENVKGASEVQIPTWTEINGQDDVMWYAASQADDGSWSALINTSRHGGGRMVSHVYADGAIIGGVSYTAPVPDGPAVLAIPRMFSVYTLLISNLPDAAKVQVPIWSTAYGQDDIVWYDAVSEGNGIWSVAVRTADHGGGSLTCHIYGDGQMLGSAAFAVPAADPLISTELLSGTRYSVIVRNLWGAEKVQVPTWGLQNGQDDIIWYTAKQTAPGTWQADINAASHDPGTVISHVYADRRAVSGSTTITRDYLTIRNTASSSSTPDLSKSRSRINFGLGREKTAAGQPADAVFYSQRYGKYDADFIGPASGNSIRLTFDEGYENGYTASILDTLKEKNVRAVFFVTAHYVQANPDLVRRMIAEGHEVGSHSVSHPIFPNLSNSQALKEVMDLHRMLQREFGYDMRLFRFPTGAFCERDLALLQALGYRSVFWSFGYRDWDPDKQPGSRAAMQKLTQALHPGAIYLLHAVSRDNAAVLGSFIDLCRQRGYTVAPYDCR